MPTSYRGILVGLMVANLVLVCVYEYFVVNRAWFSSNTQKENDLDAKDMMKEIDPEAASEAS
jgi:hypothetical protein